MLLEINKLDLLWARYVGCHKLSERDEIERLRLVQKHKVLPWKQLYSLYYQTKRWKRLRLYTRSRDKNQCVECHSKFMLHVDHIRYNEIIGAETIKDLQTLCVECHANKTKYDIKANMEMKKQVIQIKKNHQLFMALRAGKSVPVVEVR